MLISQKYAIIIIKPLWLKLAWNHQFWWLIALVAMDIDPSTFCSRCWNSLSAVLRCPEAVSVNCPRRQPALSAAGSTGVFPWDFNPCEIYPLHWNCTSWKTISQLDVDRLRRIWKVWKWTEKHELLLSLWVSYGIIAMTLWIRGFKLYEAQPILSHVSNLPMITGNFRPASSSFSLSHVWLWPLSLRIVLQLLHTVGSLSNLFEIARQHWDIHVLAETLWDQSDKATPGTSCNQCWPMFVEMRLPLL